MFFAIVVALFFAGLGYCVSQGIFVLYPLLGGLAGVALAALRGGCPLNALVRMAWAGVGRSRMVVEVLFCVGALTAAWRASGVIAWLVYHGLGLVGPEHFLVGCFLLTAGFSVLLGSSIGATGVAGIALLVMARSAGFDPVLTAGAVLSGAFFGDRWSPMSSSAYLVAGATGTDVRRNLAHMLRTTPVPLALTLLGYVWLNPDGGRATDAAAVTQGIAAGFALHPVLLLPVAVVLAGALPGLGVKKAMFWSTLAALGLAVGMQDTPLADLPRLLVLGYAPPDSHGVGLFQGGGWISVFRPMTMIVVSSAMAGILEGAGLLRGLRRQVLRLYRRVGGYVANLLLSLLASALTCTQTLAVLLTARLQLRLYAGPRRRERLALMLEDSVILTSALAPWNVAIALPLSMLDAGPECIPYMFFVWLVPLTAWMRTGRGEA